MKVLIIEDEQLAAERLVDQLKGIDNDIEILAILQSIDNSIEWLSKNTCDLIFLDIHLSDGICFKIFEKIKTDTPVIFTTAYDKYAIDAFSLNSIDYLLKPIHADKLKMAVLKYKRMSNAVQTDYLKILDLFTMQRKEFKKRFLIQIGNKIRTVDTNNISCFYAMDKGVYLCTLNNQNYTVDMSLDKLEEELDPEKFFRINRKLIINSDAIQSMESYTRSRVFIKLITELPAGIECIVSIEKSPVFKDWLNK